MHRRTMSIHSLLLYQHRPVYRIITAYHCVLLLCILCKVYYDGRFEPFGKEKKRTRVLFINKNEGESIRCKLWFSERTITTVVYKEKKQNLCIRIMRTPISLYLNLVHDEKIKRQVINFSNSFRHGASDLRSYNDVLVPSMGMLAERRRRR